MLWDLGNNLCNFGRAHIPQEKLLWWGRQESGINVLALHCKYIHTHRAPLKCKFLPLND
jgi:hypothetical protein